jgi:hypothetical protein
VAEELKLYIDNVFPLNPVVKIVKEKKFSHKPVTLNPVNLLHKKLQKIHHFL